VLPASPGGLPSLVGGGGGNEKKQGGDPPEVELEGVAEIVLSIFSSFHKGVRLPP